MLVLLRTANLINTDSFSMITTFHCEIRHQTTSYRHQKSWL